MYACSINSGWGKYSNTVNLIYMDDTLKVEVAQYTLFQYYVSLGGDVKPIFGIISDTFFPFKYR
jgi:hypothetical protein